MYEGKLIHNSVGTDVFIHICRNEGISAWYIHDLQRFNGEEHVATCYSFIKFENNRELAFTNHLLPMNSWFKDRGKEMWRKDHKMNTILGFGQASGEAFH